MPILLRDYETRSQLLLKAVGSWKYSKHPTTEVLCCAYAVDDSEIQLWIPGDPVPQAFIEAANNPNWLIAHSMTNSSAGSSSTSWGRAMAGLKSRSSGTAACKLQGWRWRCRRTFWHG